MLQMLFSWFVSGILKVCKVNVPYISLLRYAVYYFSVDICVTKHGVHVPKEKIETKLWCVS